MFEKIKEDNYFKVHKNYIKLKGTQGSCPQMKSYWNIAMPFCLAVV
jgi:hypothetical protein